MANGCAVLSAIRGNTLPRLERTKDNAKSEVFDCTISVCFEKVLDFVKNKMPDTEILKLDRRNYSILLLVVRPMMEDVDDSVFAANSADVAIFLAYAGDNKTKVEINSLSSLFVDYTAEKVFAELTPPKPPEEPLEEQLEETTEE
ncbi:MAG: hypothetical protein PHG69_06510 [Candidatus Omnitrophica bacterium]|nr:hypothetical protein [Candidatus Omnitrophota bacterium]